MQDVIAVFLPWFWFLMQVLMAKHANYLQDQNLTGIHIRSEGVITPCWPIQNCATRFKEGN